ncbi:class I SAM-dependent methyltransferase [Bradyrhizobium sp. CNPSo 4010]|uniref:Class I SAM-dependent methyltransferase n=1 Tax=Bradyrhizobium agreste TaxID=2751811 RepID=A0ABS0PS24_9BRAD|nr:class I SAM-dependent methyltransferase [Bradyrhizobium agreste]MBH5399925.1 class I SAM-dependent methyltransferase [Bradyrhizobium agreste]
MRGLFGSRFRSRSKAVASLTELAIAFDCDKHIDHDYIPIYERLLEPRRFENLKILEIGIGGYQSSKAGGNSLRMWASYAPEATIYGIDLHEKDIEIPANVRLVQLNQTDRLGLRHLAETHGPFDLVIDDGSHIPQDSEAAFITLFPYLSDNGSYVIEDIQTSFNSDFQGGLESDRFSILSLVERIVKLQHTIEWKPPRKAKHQNAIYSEWIDAVEIHYNLVVIRKKRSFRVSNLDRHEGVPHLIKRTLDLERDLGTKYPAYWTRLYRYYRSLECFEQADSCLQRGLCHFPSDPELRRLLTELRGQT